MTQNMHSPGGPTRRLYRSRVDRMIGGVCGGLGEFANVDPVLIRILFVILGMMGGFGLLLYIIAVIIIPENPEQSTIKVKRSTNHSVFWGALLIVIGAVLLIEQLSLLPHFNLWVLPWTTIWAVILVGLGIFLLIKQNNSGASTTAETTVPDLPGGEETEQQSTEAPGTRGTLYRSKDDRMVAGVCGGLAKYFNMDPTIVRLLYVILTLFSKGLGILAYIILILAIPEEKPKPLNNGESHE